MQTREWNRFPKNRINRKSNQNRFNRLSNQKIESIMPDVGRLELWNYKSRDFG